jgi:hypothetical protein
MGMPSMSLMQPWNSTKFMPNTTCFYVVGHRISSPIALLMQDAMKMASSQTTFFDQFHANALYMETLSCFIYKMN